MNFVWFFIHEIMYMLLRRVFTFKIKLDGLLDMPTCKVCILAALSIE